MGVALVKLNVSVRFYEELNDFIKSDLRKKDIQCSYYGKRSVKDLVESYGVPHVEVDLILVNGESVGFDYWVEDGDRISVYPMFERFNIEGVTKLGKAPLREPRFVLDVHLGKLAKYLRMLGFDSLYDCTMDDPELATLSHSTQRILLTCDRRLLMRNIVERGMLIRSREPFQQCVEVVDRLDLWNSFHPFSRCMECNGEVQNIEKSSDAYENIENLIPPKVKAQIDSFSYCPLCHKVYWRGSHWNNMNTLLEKLLSNRQNK